MQVKVELLGTVAHASASHTPPSKIKTAIQLITGRIPTFYIPLLRELQHFVQCLKQDVAPSPSAEEALKDLETISLAYKNQIRLD